MKLNVLFFHLLYFLSVVCSAQNHIKSFRDALQAVKPESIFRMPGYYLWDPSVIEVDGKYHLFASRWPEDKGGEGWYESEIIRATSDSLFGPYTFQEVVMTPKGHPWATRGCHNPKIMKLKDKFLLYYLGIPVWQTGFAYSDKITGPWKILPKPTIPTNNPSVVINSDNSVYAVGKRLLAVPGAKHYTKIMQAFEAKNIDGPYTLVNDTTNRLPNNYELEDPTIWRAKDSYHIICMDWQGKATGVWKGLVHYSSVDGINYILNSKTPLWNRDEILYFTDGNSMKLSKVERPQVFLNKDSQVIALLVAAEPYPKGSSFIIIRPVDKYEP